MKLKVAKQIPIGTHTAALVSADETMHPEYGSGIEFRFRVVGGDCDGQSMPITCSIDRPPTPKNKLGRMLSGFLGRPLTPGEDIDVAQFVGRHFVVVVGMNASGDGTTITAVLPASAATAFASGVADDRPF